MVLLINYRISSIKSPLLIRSPYSDYAMNMQFYPDFFIIFIARTVKILKNGVYSSFVTKVAPYSFMTARELVTNLAGN